MKRYCLIFVALILLSCNYFWQLELDKDLSKTIQLAYQKDEQPVDLVSKTEFQWDNYIILGPYQIPKKVAHKYNINLSNISDDVTLDDTKYTLIFLQNRKAIKVCQLDSGVLLANTKQLKM